LIVIWLSGSWRLVRPRVGAPRRARRRGRFDRPGLDVDPRVDVLLIRGGAPTTDVAVAREALRALVEELDEAGWDLQDQIEEGAASDDDYLRAFGQARAASALYEATGNDAHLAALEAVYEARMVVGDPGEIRSTIIAALDGQGSGDESGDESTGRTAGVR
jgi:hypothetical protein